MLVFGVFVVLVGITATAQASMISGPLTAANLKTVVEADASIVRSFANANLSPGILDGSATPAELDTLERALGTLVRPGQILRAQVRLSNGLVLASSNAGDRGSQATLSPDFTAAVSGTSAMTVIEQGTGTEALGDIGSPRLLREYLPISSNGKVFAIVAIWRDAVPIFARVEAIRFNVMVVILSAALIAAFILFLVFRSAQGRLNRQTAALIESARRDPLTKALNHGTLVGLLAAMIEGARSTATEIGVALIDIDNFRSLNDTHGLEAGDSALLAVMDILGRHLPVGSEFGRYGPDEFLVIVPQAGILDLEPAIGRLRADLSDLSLQFAETERLPLTVSAGLCRYPEQGASGTVLLAALARTLEEAKSSGGDTVRVAGRSDPDEERVTSKFDVFRSLVIAVDTKDHYTKRHSEDVARYATFIAEQMGLGPEFIRSIELAGHLHDVGKIGVPDAILRKPGRLTEDEYDTIKQHVALGDMIVRDLPDIELIRSGIRHHHERWDGNGYLTRLAGDDIPLIARILAVCDTFSAMTTSRPYRKGSPVEEALVRLAEVAGSQLDATIVKVFITGIETAADPPLPDSPARSLGLWTPRPQTQVEQSATSASAA
jgi:diguanylate cyclase (GGDEF)-like protein